VKREEMIRRLAPPAPPCFEHRSDWLSYCCSAADEQRDLHAPGPLLFTKGGVTVDDTNAGLKTAETKTSCGPSLAFKDKTVTFDFSFGFCAECEVSFRSRMLKQDRCKPSHLVDLAKELTA